MDHCFTRHWRSNFRIAERFSEIGLAYQKELMAEQQRLVEEQKLQQLEAMKQSREKAQRLQTAGFAADVK